MQKLHQKLIQKYQTYNTWHQTKHHNKIHWGALVVFTFLVFGMILRWTPISFAADTAAPTTPTNLTVTPVSSSQINLSWTASTDDVGVTGYKIYRCAGSACVPTVQIVTSATNSYSNTGLTASTAYTYAVSAYDEAGNESDKSISVSATTLIQTGKFYYVSPTGSATWPQCTDINTPCSAQTGMKNALAGDIVYFRGGTYEVGQSLGAHGVLEPANSGTSTSPITFMAYPGETPVMNATVAQRTSGTATGGSATTLIDTSKDFVALGVSAYNLVVNTTDGSTASVSNVTTNTITFMGNLTQGSRNTFIAGDSYTIGLDISRALGNGDKDYIIFDGFTVQANNGTRMGGIIITGENRGTRVVGNQVKNCIINGGSVKIAHNDNREGLRLDDTTDTTVSGCRFYNFRQEGTGVKDYPNTSAIKTYHNDGIIFENNEIYNSGNGLFLKSKTDNAIVRYNYFHNNYRSLMIAIFYTNQAFNTNGNKYYHNVFANNTFSAFASDTQCGTTYYANDAEIYNNTIYNSVRGISYMQNEPGHGAKVYNNIIQGNSNLQLIGICEPAELIEEDHNQFGTAPLTIGMRLYGATQKNYTNLSPSWIGSSELVGGNHPGVGSLRSDPLFVNGSGTFTKLTDFKLSSSSPSKGTGRNGADMGANIDLVGPAGTGKIDITPPSIPTLTATPISSSQINLSWTASTDDVGVTGYKIYRCSGSGCAPTTQIATLATNSYSDTGLTASTAYTYTVSAFDAAGNESGQSSSASATTQATPTGNCSQTNILCVDDTPGTTQEYSTIQAAVNAAQPGDTVLVYAGTYTENVDITNSCTSTAPCRISQYSNETVVVNGNYSANEFTFDIRGNYWTISGLNIKNGGYRIIRVYLGKNITIQNNTIYNDSLSLGATSCINSSYHGPINVHNNIIYNCLDYGLDMGDMDGNEVYSNEIYDVNIGIKEARSANAKIHDNWIHDLHPTADPHYGIYLRDTQGTLTYNNVIEYNHISGTNGGVYVYNYGAENSQNGGIYNNTINNNGGKGIVFYGVTHTGWNIKNNIIVGATTALDLYSSVSAHYGWNNWYNCSTNVTGGVTPVNDGGNITSNPQFTTGAKPSPYYELQSNSQNKDFGADLSAFFLTDYKGIARPQGLAWDIGAFEFISGAIPDIESPSVPTNLTATPISSTQINLSWTASTDDVGVTGYKIYRCSGSGCAPTTQIATLATNSYSDTGLTASTAYTYTVSAFDAAGNESAKSQSVSATTLSQFKPSDLNQDQKVDQLDFDILKQDWNRTDKPVSDLNQDGVVDSRDLGIMMSQWNK